MSKGVAEEYLEACMSKNVPVTKDDYESVIETLEILSDPDTMAQLKDAEEELRQGKTLSEEEFWRAVQV